MKTYVIVEVTTDAISTDNAYPELQNNYIYDHLRHYCSKFRPLPILSLVVAKNKLVVTRNHVYLRIARDLGHESVRAVMSSKDFALQKQLAIQGVLCEVSTNTFEEENQGDFINAWHIFFFKSALTREIRDEVEFGITRLLKESVIARHVAIETPYSILRFTGDGCCLEVQFNTPVHNFDDFYSDWFCFWRSVSHDLSPVLSYQGILFDIFDGK